MASWTKTLAELVVGEFKAKPAVVTLATVGIISGKASANVRSVVVRQVMDDGTLLITSDARSDKNVQLRENPSASAVFWFPSQRKQVVVNGEIHILDALDSTGVRDRAWRESSDTSRALFFWPPCGKTRKDEDFFCSAIKEDAAIPESFEVLLLKPACVEALDVSAWPHVRIRWERKASVWQATAVNP